MKNLIVNLKFNQNNNISQNIQLIKSEYKAISWDSNSKTKKKKAFLMKLYRKYIVWTAFLCFCFADVLRCSWGSSSAALRLIPSISVVLEQRRNERLLPQLTDKSELSAFRSIVIDCTYFFTLNRLWKRKKFWCYNIKI